MFKIAIVVLVAVFGAALSFPLEFEDVFEDEYGRLYAVVPVEKIQHERVRRQTDYKIGSDGAFLSHKQTLINNDKHRLDGTVFAQKPFAPVGPLTAGGKVDYAHKPSASVFSLGASNTRHQGTDVSASGQYNFIRSSNGRATVGAYGQYDRHFGGMQGTQRPNWEAGIRAKINF